MEAVRIRQRGAEDFASYYEHLCALEGTCPVASIRAGAREGVLTCFVYRIQRADWHPLLAALRVNKALHTVVFYDKWEGRVYPKARRLGENCGLGAVVICVNAACSVSWYGIYECMLAFFSVSIETGRCNTVLQPAGDKVDRESVSNITR